MREVNEHRPMTITTEQGHEAAEAAADRVIVVCGDEVWSGEIKRFGKDRYYVKVQTDAAGKPHRYSDGLAALRETWGASIPANCSKQPMSRRGSQLFEVHEEHWANRDDLAMAKDLRHGRGPTIRMP
jgi:hypothetical protein